jgi:tol-pal system protein YbgF
LHWQQRSLWVILVVALATMASACGPNRAQVLTGQLEELRSELSQLRASSAHTTVMMEDLQNKILLMEDQVESNQILLSRAAVPEPVLPIVRLSPPNRAMLAAVPEQAESPVEEPTGNTDVPVVEFANINEFGQVVSSSGGPVEPAGAPPSAAPPARERKRFDSRPIELYKHAFAQLQEKHHQEAIDSFDRFLEQYPSHDYSDNALYWMGEAYYDVQNYGKALECFQKVVTLYPSGNKVPDALLKSGLCYANSGDPATAKDIMGQLLAAYPATRAANIAQKKLQAMP